MRPIDLAREHGLSAQAVRNYEQIGALPVADRSPAGHRRYTARHAAALRAFLTLVRAIGHRPALDIMTALHRDEVDLGLTLVDRAHLQLLRDRETLDAVERAVDDLDHGLSAHRARPVRDLRIGETAGRLGVSPATLRHWERLGLVAPLRERPSGHRLYSPAQVRDAELAHLLRRGGHRLEDIAVVLEEVRSLGETSSVRTALVASRSRITARGRALLGAAAVLDAYLECIA